jgi:hypothetical protein
MKPLDVFMPRLVPWVIGCPDPLLRQAIVDAAIEFCEITGVIQTVTTPVISVLNTASYTLSLPAYSDAVTTKTVWYGLNPLSPAAGESIDIVLAYVSPVGTNTVPAGLPKSFYETSPGVIGIYPVPDSTNLNYITAKVALKPTRDAAQLDDLLYSDWLEAIVFGARKRLHAIPDQAFSSETKMAEATREFQRFVTKASNMAKHGRVQGSLAVQQRAFA